MKPINVLALTLGLAVLLCMPMYADEKETTTYNFETINFPGDTFTQLLGINNANVIAGYHGATVNQGFTYTLANNTFTMENFPKSQQTQVIGINNNPFKSGGFYIMGSKTIGFTDYKGTFTNVSFPKKPFNQ